MRNNPITLSAVLLCTLTLFLRPPARGEDAPPDDRMKNLINLTAPEVANLGIESAPAEERPFNETVFALGRIEVMHGKRVVISSRIEGRADQVRVSRDQRVKAGDELIVVENRNTDGVPQTLTAPSDGLVAVINIHQGQPISPEDELLEIVNLDEVHAIARVPEHLAGSLKVGLKATFRVPAFPDRSFPAELQHLSTFADPETGTIGAAFHVENPDFALRPGMRAEFSIITKDGSNLMSVPAAAVQGEGGNKFLFIKDYELPNAFVKVPVVLGERNDEFIEIKEGLLPGDEVVVKGAYSLAFAGKGSVSLKEAMDAAHGHPHNEDGSEMTAEQIAAAGADHDHDHEGGSASGWTVFFACTTGLLLLLQTGTALMRGKKNSTAA